MTVCPNVQINRFLSIFSYLKLKKPIKHRIITPGKVTPKLSVPKAISPPNYSGIKSNVGNFITIKGEQDIARMRESCRLASHILQYASQQLQVGTTLSEIDHKIHKEIIACGAYPSTLGYLGFPKSCCISVNNVVCHGIPDDNIITDGDIVNVDVTVFYNGFHGDNSDTFMIGEVDNTAKNLINTTHDALNQGISICKPGVEFFKIGRYIDKLVEKSGFSICKNFVGHGIGIQFHEGPCIDHSNVGNPVKTKMKPGMTFTIEPILMEGQPFVKTLSDGWTVVSCDNLRSAQAEHTILITEKSCEILTKTQD